KLAEWHPPAGRQQLTVPHEATGWAVTVTSDRCDVLGCLLWEVALRRPTGSGTLQAWAERIAGRVTGLLEPLKGHEVEGLRNEALLRSDTPARRGEKLAYYEVLLRGTTEAIVRRYHGTHDSAAKREQVAFPLTHEALAKLASDLAADR